MTSTLLRARASLIAELPDGLRTSVEAAYRRGMSAAEIRRRLADADVSRLFGAPVDALLDELEMRTGE